MLFFGVFFFQQVSFLIHIQLIDHQDHSDLLFCRFTFQLDGSQHVLVPEVVLPQVQDSVFLLVELHDAPASPALQPGNVSPLGGSMTIRCIYHSI